MTEAEREREAIVRRAKLAVELRRAADRLQEEQRYSGRGEPYASLMRRAADAIERGDHLQGEGM